MAKFEARQNPEKIWIWEVWDIEHEAECNHFPFIIVDGKGACDDLHEEYARLIVQTLNNNY